MAQFKFMIVLYFCRMDAPISERLQRDEVKLSFVYSRDLFINKINSSSFTGSSARHFPAPYFTST